MGHHDIPNLPAALTALACVAAIGACGSSTGPSGAGAGGPLLRYAQCMRAHGLASMPDPSPGRGLAIPNDIDTASPAFRSAQQACGKLVQPPAGQAQPPGSREPQLLALARCMRAHGVATFADPRSSPPPPSGGNAIGGNGAYLSLGTAQERRSPAYKRAAAACGAQFP
jgi:hypothetical protein